MSTKIKIGHASISEKGTAYGDAGDQTGTEVCIVDNYDIVSRLNPTVVLRPKTTTLAAASVKACEDGCNNSHIGYSQSGRNTLYNLAKELNYDLSKVGSCNTDCSAFMTVCAIAGGSKISYGTNAPTTSNMRTKFKQSGDYTVLTDSKHLTQTDYLKRGDILVKEGSHTVMVLENGSKYKDDTIDLDEPGTAGVTSTVTVRNYLLDVIVDNIKSTSASVKFKVIERKNNVEKILTDTSKWKFSLNIKALKTSKETNYNFTSDMINLTNLSAGNTYMAQVSALKNDELAFCSTYKIFTTDQKTTSSEEYHVEFRDSTDADFIDKVYIKDTNAFKQAIIYKNI